jgi:hypothetical protein
MTERTIISITDLPDWATVDLKGKIYTTHKGLVSLAHQHGIQSIITELIEFDSAQGSAVMMATATGDRGTYTGIGDANPGNVGAMVAVHAIRMAETRAVNRALRLYLGIGICSHDELGPDRPMKAKGANGSAPRPAQAHRAAQGPTDGPPCPKCGGDMWDNREDDGKAIYRCKSNDCVNDKGYKTAIWRNDPVWGIDPPGSKVREAIAGEAPEQAAEPAPKSDDDNAYIVPLDELPF